MITRGLAFHTDYAYYTGCVEDVRVLTNQLACKSKTDCGALFNPTVHARSNMLVFSWRSMADENIDRQKVYRSFIFGCRIFKRARNYAYGDLRVPTKCTGVQG